MKKQLLSFFVLFSLLLGVAQAQTTTISGSVVDEAGKALAGVSVLVTGTPVGTQTDGSGNYRLTNVPQGSRTLTFSYIGYETKTANITGGTINMTLSLGNAQLNEVVVTGYTTTSRSRNVSASSNIGARKIENVPTGSFDQILQGQAAGLTVMAGSGQPGASARVQIRGSNTISGSNSPLYVVDGIPIEPSAFRTMNPNDFASINVLKDAAGTALYGSRGANGVLVITTKRGVSGKVRITYDGQFGWDTRTQARFDMMNTEQYLALQEKGRAGAGWTLSPLNQDPRNTISLPERARRLDSLKTINTDWEDVFFRTGSFQQHGVSASGGNEKTKFFGSLGYYSQDGIALRSELDRYTMRLNVDHTDDRLTLGMQTNLGYSSSSFIESERAIALANPFAAAYLAYPFENPYGPDGRILTSNNTTTAFRVPNPFTPANGVLYDSRIGANALDRLNNSTNLAGEVKALLGANASYEIYEGLKIKTNLGLDYRNTNTQRSTFPNSLAGIQVARGNQGSFSNDEFRRLEMISTSGLQYDAAFGKHEITANALFEAIRHRRWNQNYTGYGINPKLLNTPAGITPGTNTNSMIPLVGGYRSEYGFLSYIALANYTYDDKYTFQASFRRDGASRLPVKNRWNNFYSLGANWQIHKEDFLLNSEVLNNLILRASHGTAAGQLPTTIANDFGYLPTYGQVNYAGIPGIAASFPGNPEYDWEYTTSTNVGLDFGFFNNRLSGMVDVFYSKTNNLFIDQQLSRTSGFTSLAINAGSLRNKGIEVSLTGDVLRSADFVWSLNADFSYIDNKITDLGQATEYPSGTSIIRVGLPIGSHYIPEFAGVDPETGNALYFNQDGTTSPNYNETAQSVAKYGTYNAPFFGGFGTTLSYKGFSMNTLFSFFSNYSMFNNQSFFWANTANFSAYNQATSMERAWSQPGDITDVPRLGSTQNFDSRHIEDASFLRWRNLTLRYTFPTDLVTRTKYLSGISVYAIGQNLATWTKFTGFDPENSNNIAQFNYPLPRTFTLGAQITF